ncbi:MAG: cysteine peptidase family C39 domain-containing protein, partial [Methanobacteriaceae archaeon]|nr:cysteine peptidase family C39 domain-containing protein [Methanobacteriaceae archaeon]
DKWIVMNVNSTCDRSNRTVACYNYVITADLTHDNQGNDTSGDGNIPDGIPVNFNTTVGTVSTGYTRNGKTVSNLNSSVAGLANVSVTLDNQTNNITVNVMSINVLGIYNNRTNEGFTTIQGAINDNDTLNGDIITLSDGTYTENVVVNKTVIIKPVDGSLVTITGSDPSLAIFTINNSGSGSIISGLTLMGSEDSYGIFLNATNNCNITGNVISGSDIGIYLYLSNNNTIQGNSFIDNYCGLGLYNSTNNVLSGNYLTVSTNGIYLQDSSFNTIIGNNVSYNWDAINLVNSTNNSILNNTLKDNWIGSYLYLSNNTLIHGNNFEENGAGICYYDSNNTIFSANNFTGNWIIDASEIDSNNIVVATTIYTCGPAALATVMMHMGLNATEENLANWAGTDETGTSMWGLVQAANKTGLTAYGLRLSIDQLKTDYIVVLSIDDNKHYAIIRNITNSTVYLIDPNLGNIEMNLTDFNNAYTGYALVINNTTEINGTLLNNDTMKEIKGLYHYVKKYYYHHAGGYMAKKWVKRVIQITTYKRVFNLHTMKFEIRKIVTKTVTKWVEITYYVKPYTELKYYWKKVADKVNSKTTKTPKITVEINTDKLYWNLQNDITFAGGLGKGIKAAIALTGAGQIISSKKNKEPLIPSMKYLKTPWLIVKADGKTVLVKRFSAGEIWYPYRYGTITFWRVTGLFAYK